MKNRKKKKTLKETYMEMNDDLSVEIFMRLKT